MTKEKLLEKLNSFQFKTEERWPGNDGSTLAYNDPTSLIKEIILFLNSEREWQPIETAPKDGTEILLCAEIGQLSDTGLCYWRDDEVMQGWTWGMGKAFNSPTKWMPLPVAPNKTERLKND